MVIFCHKIMNCIIIFHMPLWAKINILLEACILGLFLMNLICWGWCLERTQGGTCALHHIWPQPCLMCCRLSTCHCKCLVGEEFGILKPMLWPTVNCAISTGPCPVWLYLGKFKTFCKIIKVSYFFSKKLASKFCLKLEIVWLFIINKSQNGSVLSKCKTLAVDMTPCEFTII